MDETKLKNKVLQKAKPLAHQRLQTQRQTQSRQGVVRLACKWWRQAVVVSQWFGVPIDQASKAVAAYGSKVRGQIEKDAYALLVNESPADLAQEVRFNSGAASKTEAAEAVVIAGSDVWRENLGRDKPITLGPGDLERIMLTQWPAYEVPIRQLGELAPPIGSDEANQKK